MLTFLLAASIGLGTPDAKLIAVVAAHVSEVRAASVDDPAEKAFTAPAVRPRTEAYGRALLPKVDLLSLSVPLPPHFRSRP